MDNVEILTLLLQYGIAGLALWMLYNLVYYRISRLEEKLVELIREVRLLREELKLYNSRERG